MKTKNVNRCPWVNDEKIYQDYHDKEWGVPVHDERLLFEYLNLEGMQAGLSWLTILKRRENYRKCFANFDAKKIAKFDEKKIETLLQNEGIIRNRLKVNAIVTNAKAFLILKKELGSFSDYIWRYANSKPSQATAEQLSKDLKKRGFKFVGSTIIYAFMQAIGMVNDHAQNCFRRNVLK